MTHVFKVLNLLRFGVAALLVYWAFVYGAEFLGYGCFSKRCFSGALPYGPRLFLGALLLAIVGHSLMARSAIQHAQQQPLRPFTAMAVGLVTLVVYVYLRSLFNHWVVDLPISRAEILALVAICTAWLIVKLKAPGNATALTSADLKRLAFDLTLLLAICMLVADREMPRAIMLSTDPDSHAFFAKQVERFGAVPYNQRGWGDQSLNYPAGSAVLIYLWSLVAFTDIRSLVTALPVMLSLIAALIMAETALHNVHSKSHRLIVQLSALALLASAWMFPAYPPFVHMEGTGRQLSIVFAALFISYATSEFLKGEQDTGMGVLIPAGMVFTLTLLNPANIVIPAGVLFALFVHRWVSGRSPVPPLAVLALALAMLFLDPYFQHMMGIVKNARVDTVAYNETLSIKTLPQIAQGAVRVWTHDFVKTWREMSVMLFEERTPQFVSFLVFFAVCLVVVQRGMHWSKAAWIALAAFLVSVFLVYGFAQSLADDRRFYLLGPYVFFSMSHYKSMLLILLVASILAGLAVAKVHRLGILAVAVGCFLPVHHVVRFHQEMLLDPRKHYCGSLGCPAEKDIAFLERLQSMAAEGRFRSATGPESKVLTPNFLSQMGHEGWIFPASAARLLPYYEIMPAAFYYYQGDTEYGTVSYQQRVCERLDREWLFKKGIRYVFLPSEREGVCIAGMEGLIQSEEIVAQEGNAYLLKLRPPR